MVGIKYLLCMNVWQCSSETQNVVQLICTNDKEKTQNILEGLDKILC